MKIVKKGIKKAVIIYEDPDIKEGRRVMFGEFPLLMNFMMEQLPLIWNRLQKISGKEFNNPFEMISYYKKNQGKGIKNHSIKAGINMEMDLSYEVKKVK